MGLDPSSARRSWLCRCSCGTLLSRQAHPLTSGRIVSCGCAKKERCQAGHAGLQVRANLIGKQFGRLTVEALIGKKSSRAIWRCRCTCGLYVDVPTDKLRTGHTSSCGCARADGIKKHDMSKSGIYRIWAAMKRRCLNPADKKYQAYGGRGITVCERWLKFGNFFSDMGHNPPGMSIERVDNNRGYEPGNCIWALPRDQARNTRRNLILTIAGEQKCAAEWAEILSVDYCRLRNAIRKHGDRAELVLSRIKQCRP